MRNSMKSYLIVSVSRMYYDWNARIHPFLNGMISWCGAIRYLWLQQNNVYRAFWALYTRFALDVFCCDWISTDWTHILKDMFKDTESHWHIPGASTATLWLCVNKRNVSTWADIVTTARQHKKPVCRLLGVPWYAITVCRPFMKKHT